MGKGGHLTPHNHSEGWLSGVLYLKMPSQKGSEGSIEFGLHANEFPVLNHSLPTKVYRGEVGDLLLFPSSLFHVKHAWVSRSFHVKPGDWRLQAHGHDQVFGGGVTRRANQTPAVAVLKR